MAYQYRQGARARTGFARNVTAVSHDLVTLDGALGITTIGAVTEWFSSGANDGFYTLTEDLGGNQYRFRPVPSGVVSGQMQSLTLPNARGSSTSIGSIVAISGTDMAVVYAPGYNFETNEVHAGDRAYISGQTTTPANNGGWVVTGEPLDEDRVVVRSPDNFTGLVDDLAGEGNLLIRQSAYRVVIDDPNADLGLATLMLSGVAFPGPVPASGSFGPASIRNLMGQIAGGRSLYWTTSIGTFEVTTSGLVSPAEWVSENELFFGWRAAGAGGGGDMTTANRTGIKFTGPEPVTVRLGLQQGNRFSARNGSAWSGVVVGIGVDLFGSYMDQGNSQWPVNNGAGSIGREAVQVGVDGTRLESMVFYGTLPVLGVGSGNMENILIASKTAAASFNSDTVLEGFLLSDDVDDPASDRFVNLIIEEGIPVRNPREAGFNLVPVSGMRFMNNPWRVEYTWNRRLVANTESEGFPAPVSGAFVRIWRRDDGTGQDSIPGEEVLVFSGFTNASGLINAGSGVNLQSQRSRGNPGYISHRWNHRVVIEAEGYQVWERTITMNQKLTSDLALAPIRPDWESEFNE